MVADKETSSKSGKGSRITLGVVAACEIYARKLLGPAFKMVGYETLPTGNGHWNFMVTARHRETAKSKTPLDVVFAFTITDKDALKIIDIGFEGVYPLPDMTRG